MSDVPDVSEWTLGELLECRDPELLAAIDLLIARLRDEDSHGCC